ELVVSRRPARLEVQRSHEAQVVLEQEVGELLLGTTAEHGLQGEPALLREHLVTGPGQLPPPRVEDRSGLIDAQVRAAACCQQRGSRSHGSILSRSAKSGPTGPWCGD